MLTQSAIRIWMLSGGLAITFSIVVGFLMLPLVTQTSQGKVPKINIRQLGAAHLDWLMLSFMLGFVAGFVTVFELQTVPTWVVWAFVFGSWVNPLSYVFRAFGVNAFVFAGGLTQRLGAVLGGVSAGALLLAWLALLWQVLG